MSTTEKSFWQWLKFKVNYGLTYKGMITVTIVWLFIIVLFLSTFSEPVTAILGQKLLPITLPSEFVDGRDVEKAGRLVMLYHSIAVPFLAVCTYFVLDLMDVREKLKPHVKWPLFAGSLLASVTSISFAYFFPNGWVLHGLYLAGLSLCFYAGVMLLIGLIPTKSFPERNQDTGRNVFVAQFTLALLAFCILVSVVIGAAVGAFFGNGLTALLAEYFLRHEPMWNTTIYPILFVDAIKAHLHIMLALIDVIILLIVYRYTVPDQKGRLYLISMLLVIPGMLIMSIGAWLVTFGDIFPFDPHYLIYAGSGALVFVGVILAFTGWNKVSKEILADSYESASWFTRIKAVFKDPVKFALYFQLIWVNFVMTFGGIFLAFRLRDDSVLVERLGGVSFRSGPLAVETTVARGHWHVLATLSAVILLLLFIDMLNIKDVTGKVMGWLLFAGSLIAFGFALIYLYFPHFDSNWATDLDLYESVREFWSSTFGLLPLIQNLGIFLLAIAITVFCFHQLIEILKGKKDVTEWPE